jgi:tRNA G18 (ribose-2'-O)-methylase SpoU
MTVAESVLAWCDLCDRLVSIPRIGSGSRLNTANAATAVLYDASRQGAAAAKP